MGSLKLGSDFSGLECLSWAAGSLGIMFHYILFYSKKVFMCCYGSSLGVALGDHQRRVGVKHKLEFISEIDPKLRRLSKAIIHEPRVCYSDSWTIMFKLCSQAATTRTCHHQPPLQPRMLCKDVLLMCPL